MSPKSRSGPDDRYFGVDQEFVVYPVEGQALAERDHQIDLRRRVKA